MQVREFQNNKVKFLCDGEEIREKIRKQMQKVAQVTTVDHSRPSVRMAFWMIDPDVTIGGST